MSSTISRTSNQLKRVHAEYLCAFSMDTRRASFALDIPADGTPAFGVTAYDPGEGRGGLTWRVRMNFLVAVAPIPTVPTALPNAGTTPTPAATAARGGDVPGDGTRRDPVSEELLRSHVRDGPRGEWGWSTRASESLAPLGRGAGPARGREVSGGRSWTSMFLGGGVEADEDPEQEAWTSVGVQTVECEVPVSVWPGATAFRPRESVFEC